MDKVRTINSQVVASLLQNPNRTWVPEIAIYWERWMKEQNESTRAAVRGLFSRGQIEFAGGGWVQPDEAIVWCCRFVCACVHVSV